jgi:predicted transcriptional regulator
MTTETSPPTVTVWARLTPQEREQLERLARSEDRSLAYIVSRIIREWLDRQKEVVKP